MSSSRLVLVPAMNLPFSSLGHIPVREPKVNVACFVYVYAWKCVCACAYACARIRVRVCMSVSVYCSCVWVCAACVNTSSPIRVY
jgi:hypothetical protein